ncbi:heme oxygenase (biliverdin-producing) [Actinoplanes sp. NPDC049265]|uniref:biliverdin-producing heme oxygenase n=1 Tax=Actinoplanes sp. NPDC049265 TaxID=3363902 RepID=UPI003710CBA0
MSVADPPEAERLSVRLRSGTRADHDAAMGSGFLDRLADGRLPREAYADLAAQHYFIYRDLEAAAIAQLSDPVAGTFVLPELRREPALTADLAFLLGPGWPDRIEALPATRAYTARLRAVAFDRAPAFIAHHYTRYLGDLSGGQYLGPAIARSYGLNGDGHRFFVFDGIRPPAFRGRYRDMLDAISWPPADEQEFLAEVPEAYRHNIAVLAELKERWT